MLLSNRKVYRQKANNPKLRITDKPCVHSSVFYRFCLGSILLFLFSGCVTQYDKIEFTYKNPTKYCFDFSLNEVKKAIEVEFDHGHYRNLLLRLKKSCDLAEPGGEIFKDPINKDDALLTYGYAYFGSDSYIYLKNGKPLEYLSIYQIHVNSTSENKTCLEIITIKPRIKIGVFRVLFNHSLSFKEDKYISVDPSFIEEYEILTIIGEALGQKNMPEIKYPDSTAMVKHLKYRSIFKRLE